MLDQPTEDGAPERCRSCDTCEWGYYGNAEMVYCGRVSRLVAVGGPCRLWDRRRTGDPAMVRLGFQVALAHLRGHCRDCPLRLTDACRDCGVRKAGNMLAAIEPAVD